MPELPEVENIRRGLSESIVGTTVLNVTIYNPKTIYSKSNIRKVDMVRVQDFIDNTIGQKILQVSRNSKQLIIKCENNSLIIHLKMTGQLVVTDEISKVNKHTCIVFDLGGHYLMFNDVRKFGYVLNYLNDDVESVLDIYGLDPQNDEFKFNEIYSKFRLSKKTLKGMFLDQKIICGVGNIYSDEICFDSSILPTIYINALKPAQIKKIIESTLKIINHSISVGGSSISDYVLADGTRGGYAEFHKVYGRKNKECFKCKTILTGIVLGGRATVFCSKCQC